MNELTKIVLSSFHPNHKAMLPNLCVPVNCLTILKWMKMAGSSNYTISSLEDPVYLQLRLYSMPFKN